MSDFVLNLFWISLGCVSCRLLEADWHHCILISLCLPSYHGLHPASAISMAINRYSCLLLVALLDANDEALRFLAC